MESMTSLLAQFHPVVFGLLFFGSATTSFVIIRGLIRLFYRWHILDNPQKYGYKRAPVPYGTGIALVLNLVLWSWIPFLLIPEKTLVFVLFGLLVTVVSFIDDRRPLSPKIRLLLQVVIAAFISLTSIKIGYISNIFGGIIHLDHFFFDIAGWHVYWIPIIFTIVWYILIFNATNWSDGIPGLTSGLSSVVFLVLAILAVRLYFVDTTEAARENSIFVLSIASVLFASSLVFCLHDFRSTTIMGDSGSMFLGFSIASLAILTGGKIATVAAVFGIYIIDAFYVIVLRLLRGQNPMKGDRNIHLHHRLLQVGLSETEVRLMVYFMALLFGVSSVFLDTFGKIILFLIVAVFTVLISHILSFIKSKND